jgi:hypothetical protein
MLHDAWTAHTKGSVHTARRGVSFQSTTHVGRKGDVSNIGLVYLDRIASGHTGWPVSPLVDGIPDIENVTEALAHGPYGKCVYESDNDVCDNQV